jgi:hypothetical protein
MMPNTDGFSYYTKHYHGVSPFVLQMHWSGMCWHFSVALMFFNKMYKIKQWSRMHSNVQKRGIDLYLNVAMVIQRGWI